MKVMKRIFVVVLLIVTVLLLAYSCRTGKRVADYPNDLDGYKGYIFRSNDGSILAFADEDVWYGTSSLPLVLVEINEYKEGVISMQSEGTIYEFVAIDDITIYDCQTKELLIRRGDG